MFSRSNNTNNVMRFGGSSSSGSSSRNSNDFVNDNKHLNKDINTNQEKTEYPNKHKTHLSSQNQNQNEKNNVSMKSNNTSNNSYNSADVNQKNNNKHNTNHNNGKKDWNLNNINNKITETCSVTVSPHKSPAISRPNKSREDKFQRNFPQVLSPHDVIIKTYHCAYVSDNFLQGYLYITSRYFCFYSKLFHKKKLIKIPLNQVVSMSKKKTVKVIPNAVGVATINKEYSFGSLLSRDKTYKTMLKTWNLYKISNANNSGASSNEDERTSLDDSQSLTHQSGSTSLEETIDDSDSIQHPPSIPASETDNWFKADHDSFNKNKECEDENDDWMKDDPVECSRKWVKQGDDCGVSHISNFQPHRHHMEEFEQLDGCDEDYHKKCCLQNHTGGEYDQTSYLHIIVSIIQFCTLKNLSTPLKTYFFLVLTSILIIFLLFSTATLNIHLNYLQDLFEKLDKDVVDGGGGRSWGCSRVSGRSYGGRGCQGYGVNGDYRNYHTDSDGCYDNNLRKSKVEKEDSTLTRYSSEGNSGDDDVGSKVCMRSVDDAGGAKRTRDPNENNSADTSFVTLASLHGKLILKMQRLVKLLDKSSEAHDNNK